MSLITVSICNSHGDVVSLRCDGEFDGAESWLRRLVEAQTFTVMLIRTS
jgi:hypothetical protein